jgi:hypothetical protein
MNMMASLRRAAMMLVAAAAIAAPMTAQASVTDGLSIRAGIYAPTAGVTRDRTDFAAWGVGLEYKVSWIPQLFGGEHWSTSISGDFHYAERGNAILRFMPVSINQVYTFEEQNGHTPYAGFSVTAATYGTTGITGAGNQNTITRLGGGLILGLNISSRLYLEGRYEWFDKHNSVYNVDGFRGYIGFRF